MATPVGWVRWLGERWRKTWLWFRHFAMDVGVDLRGQPVLPRGAPPFVGGSLLAMFVGVGLLALFADHIPLGLRDAITDLVGQWSRRNPSVQCQFDATGELNELGEAVNITVYRLVQECLTNIVKHARATHETVAIERTGDVLRVTVSDDGRGMELGVKRTGLGLLGLRERVEALAGKLELHSVQGNGLEVCAQLPVAAGADALRQPPARSAVVEGEGQER